MAQWKLTETGGTPRYLRLALNVRDNAAFARVFDAPSRGLGALGYTRICTTAQHQKISAYQSVMSFVTRLRLGGQGYRPDEQHVLHEHGAALRNLVDAMGTLQVPRRFCSRSDLMFSRDLMCDGIGRW